MGVWQKLAIGANCGADGWLIDHGGACSTLLHDRDGNPTSCMARITGVRSVRSTPHQYPQRAAAVSTMTCHFAAEAGCKLARLRPLCNVRFRYASEFERSAFMPGDVIMRTRHQFPLLGLLLFLLLPAASQGRERMLNGFDLSGALIPVRDIESGGPPRDGIPSIDDPRFVGASKASFLAPEDRVLGVAIEGEAKAYPVAILNWHEIVNDRSLDQNFVVTYCPLCGSGMVFVADVGERALSFGVSGLLYNSDMLLYDRNTESLWSQLLAKAVSGPLKGRVFWPTGHASPTVHRKIR